ncbi:BTAD domain-containing putative transcriptional regulator [Euzebya sp.]|uniref:BTAD domain-containing putative transcriptional regulator n=1 Tax=Euzebya sp. TaxID=1971409 RepID=UPI0035182852
MGTSHEVRLRTDPTTAVEVAGTVIDLTPAQRVVLTALAVQPARGATDQELMAALWPDGPPATGRQSLQNHLSHLRRKLPGVEVRRTGAGYRLDPVPVTDAAEVIARVEAGRQARATGQHARAVSLLRPLPHDGRGFFADVADLPAARAVCAHLAELVADAAEMHAEALLGTGQHAEAIARLQVLVADDPGRERRWELLVLALDDAGRRGEAVEAFRRAHRVLVNEYCLDPGPGLGALWRRLHRGRTSHPPHPAVPGSALAGRAEVLDRVRRRLAQGGTALVHGVAGSGRSTVLRAVGAGWTGPVATLDGARDADGILAGVRSLIVQLAPGPAVGAAGRGGSIDQLVTELRTRLAETPGVLVVVDDADRLNPLASRILGRVLPAAHAVLLCAQTASAVLPALGRTPLRVELDPLDPPAVRAALGAHGVCGVSATAVDVVHAVTGGHVGRISQLAADLRQAGRRPADLLGDDACGALHRAVQRRLADLGDRPRMAVELAAAHGAEVDLTVLADLVDPVHLVPAVAAGLLVALDDSRLRFAHPVLHRAVQAATPPPRRREWQVVLAVSTAPAPGRPQVHAVL